MRHVCHHIHTPPKKLQDVQPKNLSNFEDLCMLGDILHQDESLFHQLLLESLEGRGAKKEELETKWRQVQPEGPDETGSKTNPPKTKDRPSNKAQRDSSPCVDLTLDSPPLPQRDSSPCVDLTLDSPPLPARVFGWGSAAGAAGTTPDACILAGVTQQVIEQAPDIVASAVPGAGKSKRGAEESANQEDKGSGEEKGPARKKSTVEIAQIPVRGQGVRESLSLVQAMRAARNAEKEQQEQFQAAQRALQVVCVILFLQEMLVLTVLTNLEWVFLSTSILMRVGTWAGGLNDQQSKREPRDPHRRCECESFVRMCAVLPAKA
jgi:hypothetical protein